ncbi:MAG TPA: sugar kinase [Stellaceae bacterium]|nr:sugar kinase [Stellaceae bacterium]
MRLAAIGECMLELRHREPAVLELGFAGDSFNTALYLARLNPPGRLAIDYVTALGDDPYSDAMLGAWRAEGIGVDHVARLPGRLPGLYLIRTDERGERRFFYYRSAAAARALFSDDATKLLLAALPAYDVLYFTAVTLSILGPDARIALREALAAARGAGRQIVFDSNYRPAGWRDGAAARAAITPFLPHLTLALPTFEDEQALWGDAAPADTIRRYAERGIEVCLKRGIEGCAIADGQEVPVPLRVAPLDTTGAGDAFNAAYLSARLRGAPPIDAARSGHLLGGTVIRYPGAILPREVAIPELPDYRPR